MSVQLTTHHSRVNSFSYCNCNYMSVTDINKKMDSQVDFNLATHVATIMRQYMDEVEWIIGPKNWTTQMPGVIDYFGVRVSNITHKHQGYLKKMYVDETEIHDDEHFSLSIFIDDTVQLLTFFKHEEGWGKDPELSEQISHLL